jgi:hypothetical protein
MHILIGWRKREREREDGGLKLLYQLMEKSKHFSNLNFNKPIHIYSPMVQSEALTVAKSLGNGRFKASTGWLDSFKKRHNIV